MEHNIIPGQDPQQVVDYASPGDLVIFLPGDHIHGINNNGATKNSIVYVDKSLSIEKMAGSRLILAPNSIPLNTQGEITTNQGAEKDLDDLTIGASTNYTRTDEMDYYIRVDSSGAVDTVEIGTFEPGPIWTPIATNVPITGQDQLIADDVYFKCEYVTGHNVGSTWYISFDGLAHYGIRVGEGFQTDYIDNVNIYGYGEIDLNMKDNLQSSFLVKDIPAAVLFHGRVSNSRVQDITMKNCHRPFMGYGDHNGTYLPGGATSGGESFDMFGINVLRTTVRNDVNSISGRLSAGMLLGHPSFRGKMIDVGVNYNDIEAATTTIECNFNLDQYRIVGNRLKGTTKPAGIHCWRMSSNGFIDGNTLVGDYTDKPMVMQHAPGGWELPKNITIGLNHNLNSVYVPPIGGGNDDCNCAPPNNLPTLNLGIYMRFDHSLEDKTGNHGVGTYEEAQFVDGIYSGIALNSVFVKNKNGANVKIPASIESSFVDANGDTPFTYMSAVQSKGILGRYFLSKGDNASNYEYQVIQGHNTKKPRIRLFDPVNGGNLFVEGNTVLGVKDVLAITYNGSGLASGIKIMVNKVEVPSYNDLSTGTYVSMQALGGDLYIGSNGNNSQQGADADFAGVSLWNISLNQSQIDEATDILTTGKHIL